ncbi:hypothetical protein Q669_21495 [Labrenzia sp. C1B10]|nr:hypothetical protein Q669_21495 [Labrenzia sp. C1B10]ERS01575.1 hypothetical protein Q675_05610 [Labrenzia sp. C1B70]
MPRRQLLAAGFPRLPYSNHESLSMTAITRLHPSILFAEPTADEAASGARRCEIPG